MSTEGDPERIAERDVGEIARMVRKYGRERVVAAAQSVQLPRPPGRRPGGTPLSDPAERMVVAEWMEQYRAEDKPNFLQLAVIDLMAVLGEPINTAEQIRRYQQSIKKQIAKGRREREEQLALAEQRERSLKNTGDRGSA